MNRPALIPHNLKEHFHNKNCCIDVRGKQAYAIKANTNNRRWHNVITLRKAAIAINYQTKHANQAVQTSNEPIHVLSFGCGADTFYWGRYRFVKMKAYQGQDCFELEYVDDGDLRMCLPHDILKTRSKLEKQWVDAFNVSGTEHVYEPATLHLPPSILLPDKEYTPDVWLPETKEFIEIKGPQPSDIEFEKCRLTNQLGFKIKMFRGAPDGFDCYEWDTNGKRSKTRHASWYRYVHPRNPRKRRRIHNVND